MAVKREWKDMTEIEHLISCKHGDSNDMHLLLLAFLDECEIEAGIGSWKASLVRECVHLLENRDFWRNNFEDKCEELTKSRGRIRELNATIRGLKAKLVEVQV